ncbi:MAG: hypothetical protein A2900_00050 [Candidatus Chisholmbacteria bacterium RIFCSPLOWO2_01_FULL_50_28]|uniref:Cytochrome C biogenesis protein transmembrane domain-containing protein n=1 Tax=Candidatus Chisholmbacteria bacterium RIFCSPHIGHO2_01_FULL_52_32 TaxID=1797591 RepID=A0A1G1VQS8_9BACT|nr:MAG: hypothetical protein A2786_00285 [Candidatus Chisholmbacteria bacterium RIFCSPHIGHO2_01_FULL_52_32]OGY20719.1 MAG: hypothetical protein A2900_00050 [Candidatus Chisholmbacteria bacterium RIFCSPLOWO2_01_FULL_50_28]
MIGDCTAVGCYLERQGGLVSFPLVTIAGLVDGINPCAIGMMVMLLGYLLVFAKKPEKVLITGAVYIGSIFATYLVIGLAFYETISRLNLSLASSALNKTIGAALLIAGLIQIKDFFWPHLPIHLRIPTASKAKLMSLVEKASLPAVVVLGVLVTVLETPCSLPLYVGTATILAQSGFSLPLVIAYFLYYNLLFVLPLIVILIVVWKGRRIVEIKEWEHRAEKWMKLSLGVVLVLLASWLLLS